MACRQINARYEVQRKQHLVGSGGPSNPRAGGRSFPLPVKYHFLRSDGSGEAMAGLPEVTSSDRMSISSGRIRAR